MESFATPYPLIFMDGEQEHQKGFVGIHSALSFKRFQSLLSQKTGVPPNQLCAVFVCRKTLKGSEKKQRLPINANTNFNILLNQHNPTKEKDCYFFVSLKRSKKDRKESRKRSAESDVPDDWELKNETSAFEGNAFFNNHSVEETSSQSLADSADMNAISLKSTLPKHPVDNFVDRNRVSDNRASKMILKRGNTSLLQRLGWNCSMERKPSQQNYGFLGDEHVQLNSPRFAALRPEDQRDLNWKWEDAFPGLPRVTPHEQWDMHDSFSGSHSMMSQANGGYSPYKRKNFSVSFSEEQAGHSKPHIKVLPIDIYSHSLFGTTRDRHARSPFRAKEFQNINHSKPSIHAPCESYVSTLGSNKMADMRGDQNAFFEDNSVLHCLGPRDGQKWMEAAGQFSDVHDSVTEEMTQTLFCQLCVECKRRNVTPIPFHWCVEDAVTSGFRGPSPAGPIGRRVKAFQIEATA